MDGDNDVYLADVSSTIKALQSHVFNILGREKDMFTVCGRGYVLFFGQANTHLNNVSCILHQSLDSHSSAMKFTHSLL